MIGMLALLCPCFSIVAHIFSYWSRLDISDLKGPSDFHETLRPRVLGIEQLHTQTGVGEVAHRGTNLLTHSLHVRN